MTEYNKKVKVKRRLKNVLIVIAVIMILTPIVYYAFYRPISYNLGIEYYRGGAYEEAAYRLKPFRNYKDAGLIYSRVLYKDIAFNYQYQNYVEARRFAVMLAERYYETSIILRDVDYMIAVESGMKGDFDSAKQWFGDNMSFQNSEALYNAAVAGDKDVFIEEAETHQLPMTQSDIVDLVYIYDPPKYD